MKNELMGEMYERKAMEAKAESYDKLITLFQNAVCSMQSKDYNGNSNEDIAKYLGCTVEELEEFLNE